MKTAEEWITFWFTESKTDNFKDFIKAIQSDAFHYGELKGLQDAREIVNKLFGEKKYEEADKLETK